MRCIATYSNELGVEGLSLTDVLRLIQGLRTSRRRHGAVKAGKGGRQSREESDEAGGVHLER